ncbi:MAG: transporter [Alphaproteobacteria bacterium]|nr:transporter [Alphaproteobacteria bacterium]
MNLRQAIRNGAGLASVMVGLLAAQRGEALELGFSEYFLGLALPMSGYLPPPGVYFWNSYYFYQGSYPRLAGELSLDIAQTGWLIDAPAVGGTFGLFATVPFIGDRNSVPTTIPGPGGSILPTRDRADISALGDTDYSMALGWHAGDHNWCFVLTAFAPTGNYDPNRIVQTGLNRPALDLKGAYTYLSLQTGVEVTGALGILLNGRNNITNYQSGIELHFEWALAEHLPFGLMVGVGGYFDQQITDDSGSGDIFGPNRARIASVGPLLSYSFKAEGQQVDVSARWFREFAAQNRPQGDTFITTLAFRL